MRRVILRIALAVVATVIVGTLAVFALLFYQGKRAPTGKPEYVALGSSYAAGLGLGDRAPGSPIACQRSVNGYPQRLARATGLGRLNFQVQHPADVGYRDGKAVQSLEFR